MLDIVLQILTIIGIVLLAALGIVLLVLALVLFFPISYKIKGNKSSDALTAAIKANWLFGLLRARYLYPEPGKVIVKLLWLTLYDSGKAPDEEDSSGKKKKTKDASKDKNKTASASEKECASPEDTAGSLTDNANTSAPDTSAPDTSATETEVTVDDDVLTEEAPDTESDKEKKGLKNKLTSKYEKIKYTILKIYDKIKHILDNIAFYAELFKDEQTQGLLKHAGRRLKKIWKNIHPRKLKADIVFGTGSPDSTGYAMGAYGILSPLFGRHVNITPDFEEVVFKGDFYAAGHITIFQVILHAVMVLLDKRLKLLIQRIKDHNRQDA